jgi:hypothetical protein
MTRKRKGGQPGNLNALKHGFYSTQFQDLSPEDIEAIMEGGLEDEIALLRVLLKRFVNMTEGFNSLAEASQTLEIAGMTATRLGNLLKIQTLLGGKGDETLRTLNDVIEEVNREFGLDLGDK